MAKEKFTYTAKVKITEVFNVEDEKDVHNIDEMSVIFTNLLKENMPLSNVELVDFTLSREKVDE